MTIIPVTLCGNIAEIGKEPNAWQCAYYQLELAEPGAAVAMAFAKTTYLDKELAQLGQADLIISTIHPDHVPRCQPITHADMEVDEDREVALYPVQQLHTVCGWIKDTGETYCDYWVANGPKLAYAMAWHHMMDGGLELMVSCVHEGELVRVEWTPPYIDPLCENEAAMSVRLTELGVLTS
jgi:hypothetical protein